MYYSLALVVVTAIWGWTFVVVHGAAQEYGVLSFLAVRFAIATAAIAPFSLRNWSVRAAGIGAGIGVVLACAYLLMTFGLVKSTPTNTGLITGLFVVFAPILNRLLFGVAANRLFWLAVGVSLIGLFLLSANGGNTDDPTWSGDLLSVCGAAALGLHIALLDRYAKGIESTVLATAQLGSAAATLVAVRLIVGGMKEGNAVAWPSPSVWFALFQSALLATALGFYVQTLAQRHLPAVRIAVILTVAPVFAALFGWLLAGDRLTARQICGAVLIVAALGLAEIYPQLRRELTARRIRGSKP